MNSHRCFWRASAYRWRHPYIHGEDDWNRTGICRFGICCPIRWTTSPEKLWWLLKESNLAFLDFQSSTLTTVLSSLSKNMVREGVVETPTPTWKDGMIPLHHSRKNARCPTLRRCPQLSLQTMGIEPTFPRLIWWTV